MGRTVKIPGMVDPHTHLRDLDWAHKATFASETAAALAGGYWAVFDMPILRLHREPFCADTKLSKSARRLSVGVSTLRFQRDNTDEYSLPRHTCGLKSIATLPPATAA
jgi:cytosine/adenosine deaminase-related metal-dependent hydrolase